MKTPETRIDPSLLKDISVLYVEDEPEVHKQIYKFLQMHFKRVYAAFNGKKGLELFQHQHPEVVLTDIRMPHMDGLEMAEKIKQISPDTPLIIITAFYEADLLVKAIDIGVDKYLRKPTRGENLLEAIYKSVLPVIQKKEIESLNEKILTSLEARVSQSKSMKDVIRKIQKVANSDFSVLIFGETGVGKSYVARIIHDLSRRSGKPFITVDIGAIPETLVESELFGHTRGAFTGANKAKKGFFEIAHGGTLFLEDLENMTLYAQSKLLRAVEEKTIFPIGSTTPREIDIRIIGASNQNIYDLVKSNQFREDLFYRLCEFEIHIPPLRDRPEDIPQLAAKFVNEVIEELDKTIIEISPPALHILKKHHWRGNVREIKNVMRRASLLCETDRITKEEIVKILEINEKNNRQIPACEPVEDRGYALGKIVAEAEKQAIQQALKKTGGKKVKTASLLQIDYKTLITKMQKYKIQAG